MTNTNRISYLDMARGIGMLLVVMGHIQYLSGNLLQYVTAFHMPLFFFISGILILEKKEEEKPYKELIKKKLYSIMLPYAVFSILSFLIESTRILIKGLDEWNVVLRQLFQSCCLQGVSTLWFLPALFMSELLFIAIRKKNSYNGTLLLVALIVTGAGVLNTYEQDFAYIHAGSRVYRLFHDVCSMVIRNLFCVGFLCAGYFFHKVFLKRKLSGPIQVLCTLTFAVISYVSVSVAGFADLRYMRFRSWGLYLIIAISGSLLVLCLCKCFERLPKNPIGTLVEYYGRNSLIIMVTHMDFRVLYISLKLILLIYGEPSYSVVFSLLIVVVVFALEVPIIWFVNRYLPFIIGQRKKNS